MKSGKIGDNIKYGKNCARKSIKFVDIENGQMTLGKEEKSLVLLKMVKMALVKAENW
jgi:hypothetical protein